MTLDEKSRYRYQGNEKQRIDYLLQVGDKADDAMTYLEKCLATMPDFGLQEINEAVLRKSQRGR